MYSYAVFGPGLVDKVPYRNAEIVNPALDSLVDVGLLLLGGGKGLDVLAEQWAIERGIPYQHVSPNFTRVPKVGLPRVFEERDNGMVRQCDRVVVFWHHVTWQQTNIIGLAASLHKEVSVFGT